MQIEPIDITELASVVLGISVVLIPILGLTARFALKPTVEALSRFFDHKGLDEEVKILDRRMALMEQQLEGMDSALRRLEEVGDFNRALRAGESGQSQESGGPSEGTSQGG